METKFQTSFIPKKPIVPMAGNNVIPSLTPQKRHISGSSLFFNLAILLFVVSVGACGVLYAWKSVSQSNQESLKQQLAERQKQFNPELIDELKRVNVKIDTAKDLISKHLVMSAIFNFLSRITVERIRYTNMDLVVQTTGESKARDIKLVLKGNGADLSAVAYQSDVLASLEQIGLRKVIKNPILSNPTLESNGLVSFSITAAIDPNYIKYDNNIGGNDSTVITEEGAGEENINGENGQGSGQNGQGSQQAPENIPAQGNSEQTI